jgi:hypothetical protein
MIGQWVRFGRVWRVVSIILKNVLLFFYFFILNLPNVFLCRVLFDTRCPKKVLGKEPFTDKIFVECFLPSVTLGKERDSPIPVVQEN